MLFRQKLTKIRANIFDIWSISGIHTQLRQILYFDLVLNSKNEKFVYRNGRLGSFSKYNWPI